MSTTRVPISFRPADPDIIRPRTQPEPMPSGSPTEISFRPYEPKEEKENIPQYAARAGARTLSRGAEAVLGLPGDIKDFIGSLGEKASNALGLGETGSQLVRSVAESTSPLGSVPSSSKIRETITKPIGDGYLEPQTRGEDKYDEFVQDLATLSVPVKGKVPFLRALGTAAGANLAKEGATSVGASDLGSQAVKFGSMLLLGTLGAQKGKDFANKLFSESIEAIPKDAYISTPQLRKDVDAVIAATMKGGISPQKQPALSLAKQLRSKIDSGFGELAASELPEVRKAINDYRFNRSAPLTPQGKFHLDQLDKAVNKQILDYGSQNPTFLNKYRDANQALSAIAKTEGVERFIKETLNTSNLSPKSLGALGLVVYPQAIPKVATAAAAAQGINFTRRLAMSPVLRQHYLNIIKNATERDAAGLARNVKLFDNEMRKQED